ncbi:hypothetical protein ANO11243_094020 [Dothideomycetidae sp. 11243]|nr:hypothetical protein ANO11243_094020 [fungal sp. No.11243]
MAHINPGRRQFYANMIIDLTLPDIMFQYMIDPAVKRKYDPSLFDGHDHPRLRRLLMCIEPREQTLNKPFRDLNFLNISQEDHSVHQIFFRASKLEALRVHNVELSPSLFSNIARLQKLEKPTIPTETAGNLDPTYMMPLTAPSKLRVLSLSAGYSRNTKLSRASICVQTRFFSAFPHLESLQIRIGGQFRLAALIALGKIARRVSILDLPGKYTARAEA